MFNAGAFIDDEVAAREGAGGERAAGNHVSCSRSDIVDGVIGVHRVRAAGNVSAVEHAVVGVDGWCAGGELRQARAEQERVGEVDPAVGIGLGAGVELGVAGLQHGLELGNVGGVDGSAGVGVSEAEAIAT
jgi:hypothetical protein